MRAAAPSVDGMSLYVRMPPAPEWLTGSAPVRFWHATVGKKAVMATTGGLLLLFLVAHMIGNLKVFFGAAAFDHYAHWLRTIGEPVLPFGWFLWILRAVLLGAVVLHIVAAAQLTMRAKSARPVGYAGRTRVRGGYAARTMRWGGVLIALFVVYHLLDLTIGTVNPDFRTGEAFHNLAASLGVWFVTLFYTAAMAALALHIRHGLWSALQTLGVAGGRERVTRWGATAVACVICGGFVIVPWSVLLGVVR